MCGPGLMLTATQENPRGGGRIRAPRRDAAPFGRSQHVPGTNGTGAISGQELFGVYFESFSGFTGVIVSLGLSLWPPGPVAAKFDMYRLCSLQVFFGRLISTPRTPELPNSLVLLGRWRTLSNLWIQGELLLANFASRARCSASGTLFFGEWPSSRFRSIHVIKNYAVDANVLERGRRFSLKIVHSWPNGTCGLLCALYASSL
ncbi:hypothetical protein C8F04DRAFT_1228293 [Mycena alexandri]|uniref:Uncharacterized protein n=1 Tax=Mycena alexandri TaxID=1745969 RepID=A0AAD6TFW1_9AGAR|nr:hypothetical protein C8F04DRAFT_1228293 [Mycena alexandri]